MKETGKFKTMEDKWFYPAIIIMGAYLIVRLIDQAKLMWIFPFDYTNDVSSFMGILHLLAKYGYHNIAPEWYGGYVLLKFYPPAWFFFTLPLYWLTKNVQIATYLSMLLLFALAGVFVALLGKALGLSNTKKAALYILLFANTVAISSFIRLGAMPTFFAWVFFIPFFCIILWYKDKPIDLRFYAFFIPSFAIMILSHPQETILAGIVLFSFFLAHKERRKIAVASFASIVITSFWWIPFLKDISTDSITNIFVRTVETFWQFKGEWAAINTALVISAATILAVFYLYWVSNNRSRREIIFFMPIGALALLVLTNIITFVPYFNQLYHLSFIMLFLLYTLVYLFSINFHNLPRYAGRCIAAGIIVFAVLNVTASHYLTPYFAKNEPIAKDVLELLEEIKEPYMFLGTFPNAAFSGAFYSYGTIYLNLSTPSGWSTSEMKPEWYENINAPGAAFDSKDCARFKEAAARINLREIISYKEVCSFFEDCNFKLKEEKNEVCLYTV